MKIKNCLLGGAVGDALGAAAEFYSLAEIRARFGQDGITDYVKSYGKIGAITDDTQMTLFTAEALINYLNDKSKPLVQCGYASYLRWLRTQSEPIDESLMTGYLFDQVELHARRAPGLTCMGALKTGECGTITSPLNDSKGCGGVMRAAPAGLVGLEDPFKAAADLAAITHGHPSGYLSAGAFAQIISSLFNGRDLDNAIQEGLKRLCVEPSCEETANAIYRAIDLSRAGAPSPEQIEKLGGGWVGEEALSIALYCALCAESFEHGVLLAVNHSGDADSTGSIAGNMLGLMYDIPDRWVDRLEVKDIVCEIASLVKRISRLPPKE